MKLSTLKVLAVLVLIAMLLLIGFSIADTAKAKNGYGRGRNYRVTAYCPCAKCCGKSDGITATGTRAKQGRTVAVDPDVIPYGSTVVIYYKKEIVGIYTAEDCGAHIRGRRLDLYYDSHSDALEWGIKKCKVYVFKAKG